MAMKERVNAKDDRRKAAPIWARAISRSFSAINSTHASLSADLSRNVGAIVLSLSNEYLARPVRALSTNSKSLPGMMGELKQAEGVVEKFFRSSGWLSIQPTSARSKVPLISIG